MDRLPDEFDAQLPPAAVEALRRAYGQPGRTARAPGHGLQSAERGHRPERRSAHREREGDAEQVALGFDGAGKASTLREVEDRR